MIRDVGVDVACAVCARQSWIVEAITRQKDVDDDRERSTQNTLTTLNFQTTTPLHFNRCLPHKTITLTTHHVYNASKTEEERRQEVTKISTPSHFRRGLSSQVSLPEKLHSLTSRVVYERPCSVWPTKLPRPPRRSKTPISMAF